MELPRFIRPWTAPFHVTMDGIKDNKGCWVCSAANNKLAHDLVELMNFAAAMGLLQQYGQAKFGDEWWPGNAKPYLGEKDGARLEELLQC